MYLVLKRPRTAAPIRAIWFAPLLAIALLAPVSATTIARLSLDDMVAASDTIVEGKVVGLRTYWQGRQILTEVSLNVTRTHKGAASSKLVFIQMGGRVETPFPVTMTVPGAPVESLGDEGFYFLEPRSPGEKMIVGLSLGRVLKGQDADGEFIMHDGKRLTAGEFADEIRRAIAGQVHRPDPGSRR